MQSSRKSLRCCLATALGGALLLFAGATVAATPGGDSRASTLSLQLDTYRGKSDALPRVQLFSAAHLESARSAPATQLAVNGGSLLELDFSAVADLLKTRPNTLTLVLPTQERGNVELELFQSDLFAADFAVSTSSGARTDTLQRGLHYRGIVKGREASFAAISVFGSEIMGTFSTVEDGNWIVGKLDESNGIERNGERSGRHIVYAQSAMTEAARKALQTQCTTDPHGVDRENFATFWGEPAPSAATSPAAAPSAQALLTTKCATEWLEAEHDLYQNRGSLQATMDYMTGVFNNSSTLYANDGISLRLQQIHIWDTPDPYSGSSIQATLTSFQNSRAASFTGTIAQLLTLRNSGGIAAGFSGICNASRQASMAASHVDPTFSTVPAFSYTIQVVTHEAGHLLGSRHTHACVWNGNNTAIDSCPDFVEGSCNMPGHPSQGGTVMSYCAFESVGQPFSNGFGTQPSAVIRNRVEGGSCLANCDGGGNNGGGPLTPNVAKTNQSATAGSGLAYTLAIPADSGITGLSFTTSGGTGDADLYVRYGSAPTTSTYDCRSDSANNTETCTIAAPIAGTYHVLLQAQATFNGASIIANVTTSGRQTYSNTTDYPITDNTTVDSPITVSGRSGNAPSNASVTVAIVHTYQGDLKVDLVAPDGSLYNIHNRTGNGTDNINKTVALNLSSEALNGIWKLRVNDNGPGDIGKIDSWSVTF